MTTFYVFIMNNGNKWTHTYAATIEELIKKIDLAERNYINGLNEAKDPRAEIKETITRKMFNVIKEILIKVNGEMPSGNMFHQESSKTLPEMILIKGEV